MPKDMETDAMGQSKVIVVELDKGPVVKTAIGEIDFDEGLAGRELRRQSDKWDEILAAESGNVRRKPGRALRSGRQD